ncbi:hypothetical protein [Kribbella sp. HUAS MG21]|jgi:hypothetical protein|uniref:Uncharacterized protein n=1 Tax=Kribbella sp. HUAS MG21 TaxID=3160966 RepID=A0AAU7T692_9ACTN
MNGMEPVRTRHAYADWTLRGFPLPGHVLVLTETGWRRGWLLARENGPTGWIGLVQYELGNLEITEHLAADHIASPDVWTTGEPTSDQEGSPS